jgi:hypothetical protein
MCNTMYTTYFDGTSILHKMARRVFDAHGLS